METSKKILLVSYTVAISLIVFFCYCTIKCYNTSDLLTLTTAVWGEVSVATGFYFWKAKAENKLKIAKEMPKELLDRLDVNQIID